ncbi:MAG: hypothetical protein J4F50_08575 [Acidimicrobiia bacterium]|nr:hypothetical protein [Acidimicrobiia bacterium]
MARHPAATSGKPQRFTAAALIVAAVVLSVWLFGRKEPQPTVQVVAAAEDWPAGREPGEFVTVEMTEASAGLFVTADQLTDRVPAVPVPAGTVVSHTLLTDSALPAASDLSAALLAVAVDPSLWPEPGPRAGDAAVLAEQPGGCATAVLPLVVVGEGTVVVEARPQLAEVLGPTVWWIWESPPAGWPGCPTPASQPEEPAPQPEKPAPQPEEPAPQPEEPASQPEEPAPQPEEPASQPEEGRSDDADGFG